MLHLLLQKCFRAKICSPVAVCIVDCAKLPQLLCKLHGIVICCYAWVKLPQSYHCSFVKFYVQGRRGIETTVIISITVNKHLLLLHSHQLIKVEAKHVRKAIPFGVGVEIAGFLAGTVFILTADVLCVITLFCVCIFAFNYHHLRIATQVKEIRG